MSGDSFLGNIEDNIESLIESMNAEPYNFVWGDCSLYYDMAKASYPCAGVTMEGEENLDEPDGAWGGAYFNQATFRIDVRCRLDAEYENPREHITGLLYKALDDLKRLFGINWSLQGNCNSFMYRGCEIVDETANDVFIPARMVTRWICRYEQSRIDPIQDIQ